MRNGRKLTQKPSICYVRRIEKKGGLLEAFEGTEFGGCFEVWKVRTKGCVKLNEYLFEGVKLRSERLEMQSAI